MGRLTGTSAAVEKFLRTHIGFEYSVGDILEQLGIDQQQKGAATQKLIALVNDGYAERVSTGIYKALPNLATAPPTLVGAHKKKQAEQQQDLLTAHTLTPKALINMERLEKAKDAQPIDLSSLMGQVMAIDEQNKMYRNALEQIVLLLEQAGIIEKA